jgi:hypothetical protein
VAALLDRLVARGLARRFGLTNAYRLIARRDRADTAGRALES